MDLLVIGERQRRMAGTAAWCSKMIAPPFLLDSRIARHTSIVAMDQAPEWVGAAPSLATDHISSTTSER